MRGWDDSQLLGNKKVKPNKKVAICERDFSYKSQLIRERRKRCTALLESERIIHYKLNETGADGRGRQLHCVSGRET